MTAADSFANGVRYLTAHGRPLEQALYAYHFSGGYAGDVVTALTRYQNLDGGFGHGLEPDVRLADSSVIATSVAFQHMQEIGMPTDHAMVVQAGAYLNTVYLPDEARFPIIPPEIDDAPHAPWWQYGGDLWHSKLNPTAELLGCLFAYPTHFPADVLQNVREQVTKTVQSADSMEMHDLMCCVCLVENRATPADLRDALLPKLTGLVDKAVERDPANWPNYTLPPLGIVSSPASPFAHLFEHVLPANLDFMLSWQSEDGGWHPNWNWGYLPEVWAVAERDWTSVLTLTNLKKLRAFGAA